MTKNATRSLFRSDGARENNIFTYCYLRRLNNLFEHGFVNTTDRASPVIGEICESCARRDTVLRVTFCGIISITTGIAKIFIHSKISLSDVMN